MLHVHHSHGHVYELARSFVVALTIDTALAVLTCHVRVVLAAPAVDELEPKLAVCDPLVPLERGVGTVPHKHAWLGLGLGLGRGLGPGLGLGLGFGLGRGLGLEFRFGFGFGLGKA